MVMVALPVPPEPHKVGSPAFDNATVTVLVAPASIVEASAVAPASTLRASTVVPVGESGVPLLSSLQPKSIATPSSA
jgi:hypothetical protein